MMSRRHEDEHAGFERPPKRGSRPRSKQRPNHADAASGFVTAVDRGRYTLLLDPDLPSERPVVAMKARELGRDRIVVGDDVDVVGDTSGAKDTLARIVRIHERSTVLRRTADDNDPYERVIVANADQLVVVAALAQPEPRVGMIDRAVVAAYDAGLDALLCLTKSDLASGDALRALYEPAGVQVVITSMFEPDSVAEMAEHLAGHASVLLGHSGVGKSTLVNELVPHAQRVTGDVNEVTGRGRHTSTSVVAYRLPSLGEDRRPGWVIDTPGVRSLGLAHVTTAHVLAAFEDLAEAAEECPRGCTHAADAPDCWLEEWVGDDPRRRARLDSLRRLLASRNPHPPAGT